MMYDVAIIGAGVIGSSIARELSRYTGKVIVLEKEEDVCSGTSKANSGIVHAGFDAVPGSWKARMNVQGNQRMEELSKELDFPFRRNGSVVLCFEEKDIAHLEKLKEQGEKNGVVGLRIIQGAEIKEMEPNLSDEAVAMLYAPSGGIVCPFKLTIAMAENANVNGVEFAFNTCVEEIKQIQGGYQIHAGGRSYTTRAVVNAAGIYGDVFYNLFGQKKIHMTPRKGEYCLLDKKTGGFVDKTIFQMPTEYGKGVLVTPTVHGNLLIGPTAYDIEERDGVATTAEGMAEVALKASKSAKHIPMNQVITSFAGLRAHEAGDDFILGEAEGVDGFFHAVGIESPGLTSAPAIGQLIAGMIAEKYQLLPNENFIATRKDIVSIANASPEEIAALVKENPAYGNVICRCEMVTEGEILDAINRPLGARSLDGIKRRTRAGMGRCQSGFCAPRTMEILARELGVSMLAITKAGAGSECLTGYDKEDLEG